MTPKWIVSSAVLAGLIFAAPSLATAAQSQLIEQAGIAETRGASSGLPGFLGQIAISGSL